jgi:M6 family metalloprotease-like protein
MLSKYRRTGEDKELRKRPRILILLICVFAVSTCLTPLTSFGAYSNSIGPQETIIILVEFSDVRHSLDSKDIAKTIFNDMNAYFKEQSYNQTWLIGTTTSTWYQLSSPINAYAPWPHRQGEIHWERVMPFIHESLKLADPDVDFRKYQRIVIVHSGSGGSQSMDFGYSFYWYPIKFRTNDGKTVSDVVVIGEYESLSVVCHEFAHYLGGNDGSLPGLPDLYDRALLEKGQYASTYMGMWDLISTTPTRGVQGLSSWSKMRLEWIRPKQIAEISRVKPVTVTLDPLELPSEGIHVIRIPISGKRYYLVENRQRIGSDEGLPDSGILIMLADDDLYYSGQSGPVRVVDSTPSALRLEQATFDIRARKPASFYDRQNDIAVVIVGKSGLAYTIFVGTVSQGEAALRDSERALAAVKIMNEAEASIQQAAADGRTTNIDQARWLLANATVAFSRRAYEDATAFAKMAKEKADASDYPLIYYEAKDLLAKAKDLRSSALSQIVSPEALKLIDQGRKAYDLAEKVFSTKDFVTAATRAREAISLFEKGFSEEQAYRQQTMNYLIVFGSAIAAGILSLYFFRRIRRKRE